MSEKNNGEREKQSWAIGEIGKQQYEHARQESREVPIWRASGASSIPILPVDGML